MSKYELYMVHETAKRLFALNAPPTECLCCNHVCRQRSNSGKQACFGIPYPRISPHVPPVFPPFPPIFLRFSPFSPIFPHFPNFPHFPVAQKRLGHSGVGDFQGPAMSLPNHSLTSQPPYRCKPELVRLTTPVLMESEDAVLPIPMRHALPLIGTRESVKQADIFREVNEERSELGGPGTSSRRPF